MVVVREDQGCAGGTALFSVQAVRIAQGLVAIAPTEEGTEAAKRYSASMIGWFMQAVADWTDHDRDELGRLLQKLADDVLTRLALLDDTPPGA